MNKQKKQNMNNGVLLVVVILIIAILYGYNYYAKWNLENYAKDVVEQKAEKVLSDIDTYIDSALSSIQLVSDIATNGMTENIFNDSKVVLHNLSKQTPFQFIEYVNLYGVNTTEKGKQFDAGDRTYFKEGINGNTGICINYEPRYSDEYLLNFYTPLYYKEQVVGVLTGVLGADTDILPMLRSNFLDEEMIGVMCDKESKIIASTLEMPKDASLEDLLEKMGIDKKNYHLFFEKMKNNKENVFEFYDNHEKTIACIKTNKATGWKIIQIVPHQSFGNVMRKNTTVEYCVTAAILLVLMIFLFYQVKEVIKDTDMVVQNYENILIATARETYKGIRVLDLKTGMADYIDFKDGSINKSQLGDWTSWLIQQENNIYPQDWREIYESLCLQNLNQRNEGDSFQVNYRSSHQDEDGYYRTYSTNVSIMSVGGRKTAVMSTIGNTEALKKEIRQKKILMSAASIYISMHVLDLKNDEMDMLKTSDHVNSIVGERNNHIKELIKETMSKLTDEQFEEEMMSFVDLDTLDERMQGVNTITFEFLGKISGWCRARFIAVDYDENHRLRKVLWVIENIDKEKRKANELRYLSETDLMTGIRNRGSGESKIRELIEEGHAGTFCLLDADKFKSINDQFGHRTGDKVIIEIANCLKTSFREHDIVMRLGGDEFAVFADGVTQKGDAEVIFKRFFDALNHIAIPELGERKITVSVGAAFKMIDDNKNFEKLYSDADHCAYESKKITGNAYSCFEG